MSSPSEARFDSEVSGGLRADEKPVASLQGLTTDEDSLKSEGEKI